nr:MFS transporter [uncultured Eubacterium sp.]
MERGSKVRLYLTIVFLGMAGGSIYCLPYMRNILYDAQMKASGITNMQLGLFMTMYAIGNTISYIPGGILADKISPKKALVVSLLVETALGIVYAFYPTYVISLAVWFGFSLTSAFIFWSALMKTVRLVGAEDQQGFFYGLYYAFNGLSGAATNAIAMWAYNRAGDDVILGFRFATITLAVIPGLVAVGLLFLLNDKMLRGDSESEDEKFHLNQVGGLLKNSQLWLFAIVVMVGYGLYSSVAYFTPYLTAVKGISISDSGMVSILRNNVSLLMAPIGGIIADKVFKSTAKWIAVSMGIVAVLYIVCMMLPDSMSGSAANAYTVLPSFMTMMMYGTLFSIMSEVKLPKVVTGTAIGLASMIGYSPDFWYSPLFGHLIDANGNAGYNMIFIFLIITCIIGIIVCLIILRNKKINSNE